MLLHGQLNVRNLHPTWEVRSGLENPFWRLYSWHDSSLRVSKYNRILSFSHKYKSSLTCRCLLLRRLIKFMVGLLLPNQHASISGLHAQSKKPLFYIPHQTSPAQEAVAPLFGKRIIRVSGMALKERPWDQPVRWIPPPLMITPTADGKQRMVPQAPPKEGSSQNSCCVTLMSGVRLCAWWHCWGQSFWKLLLNQPLLPLGRHFSS